MIVWRISEFTALDGAGGLLSAGRWHRRGRPVIYTAEAPALALLEALVRFETGGLPTRFQLLEIEVPEGAGQTEWSGELPDDSESQRWGSAWLEEAGTLLAKVPAAVAPRSFNWLINPAHPDARGLRLVEARRWNWDSRLAR
ncbi:RES domain-containing protein [Sphingomonas ginkgonis]|uniref:RES domain-containing protein n=1 Tax=Sphingomonas ginkgonis TaxID=2315330 RepID=A0A429VD71_9SPHN|nr:RES family NAD+ phosphorylase [Sphingomonas ginkgonis]RST31836.1 RES domain-containing protein [Sphingomonas ginkgonis]